MRNSELVELIEEAAGLLFSIVVTVGIMSIIIGFLSFAAWLAG